MTKRSFFLLALCLLLMLCGGASAEQAPLTLTAVVTGETELPIKAPITGELAPFTLRAGDAVRAGDPLLTVQQKCLYAPMDGTVSAVYAQAGDVASAVSGRFGALTHLEYESRWELRCNTMTGYSSLDNSDLRIGTPLFLRSGNKEHSANGVITRVEGNVFVAAVLDGDLVYNQAVDVYRTEDYAAKSLLAHARISAVPPLAISISGTVTSVAVKRGDVVKAGDLLLCYVPDELEPEYRGADEPGLIVSPADGAVLSLSATQGMTVSKGQVLGMLRTGMRLNTLVNEEDLAMLSVGQKAQVCFDALGLTAEATVLSLSAIGSDAETSQYAVLLSCDCPEGTRYGMHATITFQ